jgi:two-component system sensor histidine kinase MtrB
MLRFDRRIPRLSDLQRAWRRSLQFRVVTITLASSGALMLAFALLVSSRITDGLINAKEETTKQVVLRDSEVVYTALNSTDPGGTTAARDVDSRQGLRPDVGARVLIVPVDDRAKLLHLSQPQFAVPARLEQALSRPESGFVSQRLDLDLPEGHKLYLVFGRVLNEDWGRLNVYYFFPLDTETQLARAFAGTIAATGGALVIMLGVVAYLVTRMVVRPVRVAARTAQRLSNGLLDQRMEVHGEDDLAALAASFNQMAENLQRHILRLEEMSRLQRRFTSDVSHELRTPLTTVRMAADLLYGEREEFEAPVARSAELLVAELDRFEALLTELLEISRFDAGFAALDAEPANLGAMLTRVVDRLKVVAERAGVEVDLDVPSEPVVAEVDVRRVERIVRNLIGNAIEHGERKPVKVRLAAREGVVAITVRDHGVGLKAGEEKLVFNRFWRADPSRARQTGGTGLGLSISAEDAKLHGGWLEAWGALGQGAQFRLTLPARAGGRLLSSPLSLVPTDFRPPTEAEPEPEVVKVPARREPDPPPAAEPTPIIAPATRADVVVPARRGAKPVVGAKPRRPGGPR